MSAAMPSPSSNITRRRGKTLRDLQRIKALQQRQQRRQSEKTNLLSFVAVLLKRRKQRDVSIYKNVLALMKEFDDEDKKIGGDRSSLLHLRQTAGETNRSIPTSIYTRPGGSNISTLSEPDYVGGAEEKMGYLNTTYQLMTEVEEELVD